MATGVKGMILAAGHGIRLRPLTDHLPKPLFPILGRPVIRHQAELLLRSGVKEAAVNIHHLPEKIEEYAASGGFDPLKITFTRERDRILGTGGGVLNARGLLDGGTSIVVNGDTLLAADLGPALEFHRASGAIATMLLAAAPGTPDEHAIFVDRDRRVRRMVGHGDPVEGLTRCAFLGVHFLEPELFPYLPAEGCIIRSAYRRAAEEGRLIAGWIARAEQWDIGTPRSLLEANLQNLNKVLSAQMSGVSLSESRTQFSGDSLVKTIQPFFMGPDCTLDRGAEIGPGAVLSGHNRVGSGARVINSLLLPDEDVRPGEVLERTVAGFGLRVGG